MTREDFALIAALLGAAFLVAAWVMFRGRDAREDIGVMAGAGASLGALAATLHVL